MTDDYDEQRAAERLKAEEIDALYPPPLDRVDTVLDVACSVLADYGHVQGATRIERLARWVVASLDASPTLEQAGAVSRYHCVRARYPGEVRKELTVWRTGGVMCAEYDGVRTDELCPQDFREIATALLRAAEQSGD